MRLETQPEKDVLSPERPLSGDPSRPFLGFFSYETLNQRGFVLVNWPLFPKVALVSVQLLGSGGALEKNLKGKLLLVSVVSLFQDRLL